MVRGMGEPPRHHPCPRPRHREELCGFLPPAVARFSYPDESRVAVLRVARDEFEPRLLAWQGRRADVDAEHGAEPRVFADALVHEMLANAAASRIPGFRPHLQVAVT